MNPILLMSDLQELVGLLDNDRGIVYMSLYQTDLYNLLEPYIETVDNKLYFDFERRAIRRLFSKHIILDKNYSPIKKAIYHALKGQEYNLQTLIDTTKLDYDPIENYYMDEITVTTASIAGNVKYSELITETGTITSPFDVETTTAYGEAKEEIEKSMPEYSKTITLNHGGTKEVVEGENTLDTNSQVNSEKKTNEYGEQTGSSSETKDIGARSGTGQTTNTVSAYNTDTYQPEREESSTTTEQSATDKTTISKTDNSHTDSLTTNTTIGPRKETQTDSKTTTTTDHVDIQTELTSPRSDIDTHTFDAHTDTETRSTGEQKTNTTQNVGEHKTDTTQLESGDKKKIAKGRYGYNTVQAMIEAERQLANLDISNTIIDIVIHAVTEGVLYTC